MSNIPSPLGYKDDLFILAFDHRGSFLAKMFGIKGRAPTPEEAEKVSRFKNVIFEGFKKALANGVPKSTAGVLVDEQFGLGVIESSKSNGIMFANPAEKSGQDEFDFEYGDQFGDHIDQFKPSFVKVLVRYNPAGDVDMNTRQTQRLKRLSDFCHKNGHKYLFELLVPATEAQLSQAGGDKSKYDAEIRPGLMIEAMSKLQEDGVEPDIWKLEGLDTVEDAKKVADQARIGGRSDVGVVVLGRGADEAKVAHWLATAAKVPGFNGFAVGRTIFWEPLEGIKSGKYSDAEAADRIAKTYQGFYDTWTKSR